MAAIPTSYPVLVFPADGRAPHIADMPVTQAGPDYYAYPLYAPAPALVPRPEIHMEYIAEGLGQPAHRSVVRAALACWPAPELTRLHTARGRARRHDGQTHAAVHDLLSRRLARRDAVPAEQVRARDPGRTRARQPVLVRRPRRRRVQRRVRPLSRPMPGAPCSPPHRTYGTIVSAKISDFPIIKNYFMTSTAPSA
jgi:hypothetical protein